MITACHQKNLVLTITVIELMKKYQVSVDVYSDFLLKTLPEKPPALRDLLIALKNLDLMLNTLLEVSSARAKHDMSLQLIRLEKLNA